jgi:hypothetical protein
LNAKGRRGSMENNKYRENACIRKKFNALYLKSTVLCYLARKSLKKLLVLL